LADAEPLRGEKREKSKTGSGHLREEAEKEKKVSRAAN
jgi:hypothetical protein